MNDYFDLSYSEMIDEPNTEECLASVLKNMSESEAEDIAAVIAGCIDNIALALREDWSADGLRKTLHEVSADLRDIYEVEDQSPQAMGWVDSRGRP